MLHLAICDKSLNDIEQMEKYLENIKFFNFDYEVFENAKELYKYQTQHHENFDIYILSIELEDMLGLEVARKLREDSQEALIIFVSNDAKCVFDCKLCLNGMPVPLLRNCYSIFNGTKYR